MEQVDPNLTLAEAIRAIRERNGEADMTDEMAGHSARAFDLHDAVHVVFNCDESLRGEICAHVWMAFATTAPLSEMHRAVASRQHRSVLLGVGHLRLVSTWLKMLPQIAQIIRRSQQMMNRVPYSELHTLMKLSVSSIRARYGIKALP